jgi:hypothetical protein
MLRAAEEQYRAQKALTARATRDATSVWAQLDPVDLRGSWRPLLPRVTATVTAAQILAASRADSYVTASLTEQGIDPTARGDVKPLAFAGIASDGRPLDTLLDEPLIATMTALSRGYDLDAALAGGLASLVRIVGTQVADAGRGAQSVSAVARPAVGGYVRMLELPSCDRCAVLAGKWFRWNAGFPRHPLCDCQHVFTENENAAFDRGLVSDPRRAIESGQVRGLSEDDTRAILDGADVGQVINAKRGMSTMDMAGRRLKVTTEGTTKRGLAGKQLARFERDVAPGQRYRRSQVPRLRPETIYREAASREDALRLLKRFGYL